MKLQFVSVAMSLASRHYDNLLLEKDPHWDVL